MPTITKPPTTTIVNGWPTRVPNVLPHLNIDEGVDTANPADFVQSGDNGETMELGGFDFSTIPPGSIINSIKIRQRGRGTNPLGFVPAETFRLRVDGVDRAALAFNVDTGGVTQTTAATFLNPPVTRDELAAVTRFSISKTSSSSVAEPPIPTD